MERKRARRRHNPPPDLPAKSILFVDDDELAVRMYSNLLEQRDFEVLTATSAAEARAQYSRTFQVAILDVDLPDASGIDLLTETLSLKRHVVPLMLSGDATFETISKSLEQGAFWYLHKPVNPGELLEIIHRAFAQYELAQRNKQMADALWRFLNQDDTAAACVEAQIIEHVPLPSLKADRSKKCRQDCQELPGIRSTQPQFGLTLADIERRAIIETLLLCGGNKAHAARMLGISEKSIYNKMQRLDCQFVTDLIRQAGGPK